MTPTTHTARGALVPMGPAALAAVATLALVALAPEIAMAQARSATGGNFAGNLDVLRKSCDFLLVVKTFFFNALYLLAAIGLGVIAVRAYLGQFSFKSLFALGGGVFIIAVADLIISFVSDNSVSTIDSIRCVTGG